MDAFNLAERLKSLSPRTEEEASILALTFGAVYASALAEKYGYTVRKSRGGNDLVKEITPLLNNTVHNRIVPFDPYTPEENSWLAGLYFNDALVRADIAFEWTARYVGGVTPQQHGHIPQVKSQARQAGFPANALTSWDAINKEVNTFLTFPIRGCSEHACVLPVYTT